MILGLAGALAVTPALKSMLFGVPSAIRSHSRVFSLCQWRCWRATFRRAGFPAPLLRLALHDLEVV